MKYLPLITMMFCQVLFSTCKKQIKETYVEGIARDYYSKKPLENIEVYLYEVNGLEGYDHGEIQYVNTDENGYFKFQNFQAYKDHNYAIGVKNQKGYDNYLGDINTYRVIKGKKNFLVPILIKECTVRFDLINENPFNDSDKVCIKIDASAEKILPTGDNKFHCEYSINFTRPYVFYSAGLQLPVYINIIKNNISIEKNYNFFISNDTTITIKY